MSTDPFVPFLFSNFMDSNVLIKLYTALVNAVSVQIPFPHLPNENGGNPWMLQINTCFSFDYKWDFSSRISFFVSVSQNVHVPYLVTDLVFNCILYFLIHSSSLMETYATIPSDFKSDTPDSGKT